MTLSSSQIAKSAKMAAVAVGLLCCGVVTYAASPADTIAARQANFKQLGKGMKAISDELKMPSPSIETIKANVGAIDQAAGKVGDFFPQGTGPEAGVKTAALPAIWEKNAEFKADAAKLAQAAAALRAAAESDNLDQVKAQFMAAGGTCRECHQNFRAREN